MSARDCILCFETGEERGYNPNCPNCGRWLKWEGWEIGYTCKCGGMITLLGSGDPDIDDSDYALRICKISQFKEDPKR